MPGTTVGSAQALLTSLVQQLEVLLQEAQAQGIALPAGAAKYLNAAANAVASIPSAITQSLTMGSKGSVVTVLQKFLISQAKGPAAAALNAAGATGYFGSLTKAALAEYQAAVGITPAQGYFGAITKAYLKTIGF
jgi:peptidoglycan hydrolase-like protein with peptidoglycan-binding domain